jgi:hypothetical protein
MASAPKIPIPTKLVSTAVIRALRAGGTAVGDERRAELLKQVRAGQPLELEIDATVFVQRPTPNANFVRFRPETLQSFAASFNGAPFQRDHSTLIGDRGGTVLKSVLAQHADGMAFDQTIRLVKPWACEGVLDGTLDRFSIAWSSRGDVLCSICGTLMVQGWFGIYSDCDHYPGELVEMPDGSEKYCELVFTDAKATEVSGVSVPAVDGTEIEGVRAALSLARAGQTERVKRPPKEKPMTKLMQIAALLGIAHLPDNEDEATAIIEQRAEELAAAKTQAEAQLATASKDVEEARTKALAADTDRLIEDAIREGRFVPKHDELGHRVETPIEKSIRHAVAHGGLEAGKQVVDGLAPNAAPVGRRLQSASKPEKVSGEKKQVPGLTFSKDQMHVFRQMGVTPEAIEKYYTPPFATDEDSAR